LRKKASLELWKELYELAKELNALNPWKFLGDTDLLSIGLEDDDEPVFVSFTGDGDPLKGIAVYEGLDGLGDFAMVISGEELNLPPEYVAYEQTCLYTYWGNKEDLPPESAEILKQIGVEFCGDGEWIFFLSHNNRFRPCILDEREATLMVNVYKNVIMAVRALLDGTIEVHFEEGECLCRAYDHESKTWKMFAQMLPDAEKAFPSIQIDDDALRERLNERPPVDIEVLLDFNYTNTVVEDEAYDRPVHPLLFLAVDATNEEIITAEVLNPDESEIDMALNFFVAFVEQHGKMKAIKARNPWIFGALDDICQYCGIPLLQDPLEIAENIEQEMFDL